MTNNTMIRITRLSKPTILQQNELRWTEELCLARRQYYQKLEDYNHGRLTSPPSKPNAIKSRYAHQEIKTALEMMFGPKCAYCESPVTAVSYQHVEHFRPQSIYPKLAYNWNNLLLACPRCNSGHKKARFPLMDRSQPVENVTNPCLLDDSDNNALIDPCRDEPEEFFEFQDEWLVCRSNNFRASQTRDVCGLNRDDLRGERKKVLTLVEAVAKAFMFITDDSNKRILARTLQKATQSSANYAAMSRTKLAKLNITPAEIESFL
ncbi:MAG: TIGR02646 family protein [Anaerolineae bacterium]|nr:TIGR02646 family protein [Anaerolineae bacterium]